MPFSKDLLTGASGNQGAAGFYEHQIEQSVRFDDTDGTYLDRTFGTVTNEDKVSYSFWLKRTTLAAQNDFQQLMHVNDGGAENMTGDRVYRDTSAWNHFLYAVDTDNSTANYRLRFYVNGVEDLSSAYNGTHTKGVAAMYNKSSNRIYFGHNVGADNHPDFLLAEFIHVDGTQLSPTDVGEFKNGIWIPKEYTGSYGNEGARLTFSNSSNFGEDSSGNSNNWTANNFGADHQLQDSPTFGS